ncbi:bifunctional protein FolD [endosymbiont of Euscepes postfasciatus]|uniref:bifunctional 5,10-methylenetetrahydrofolate dehydrogenase/5,10-methenyltetrahydrofolate cyclohydrolase n=1 Tax=endosymbiont of Euscepes postfasciatus TaxID=650377 RepID=UPI000DC727F4|nr:bifunctional 5,10-methylenetetrahydrofolate dehydrogenase/5,10-methenyltetrahydrofolate cyclohydrolase [endosymbiont of Euscepes postfasciatus]BBA84715.1 bifunctional protein FolD [endosymbiont of Euscepes postfasciatus]
MITKILNGKYISNILNKNIKNKYIKILNSRKYLGIPSIAIIYVGDNISSNIYIKNKIKKIEYIGYRVYIYKFDYNVKECIIIRLINLLNINNNIHGILVQFPLPSNINSLNIVSNINCNKDIDCLNPYNFGKLCYKKSYFRPCTAYGIIILLQKYNILNNKSYAVVIGISNVIGKPICIELLNYGYTVTLVNKNCIYIKEIIEQADLLIIAVGIPNFINNKFNIKKGSIIIDVGINILNNKIVGDVNMNSVVNKASYITPVPGGIGPVTISILLNNILNSFIINS